VAKKRKGARPAKKASRSVKKKAVKRAAPRRAMATAAPTGLESGKEIDFRPLKRLIGNHVSRLQAAYPSDKVVNALRSLRQVQSDLNNECLPTMVIPTS
jgi:broad specificity phosphatase PhoE